MLKEAEREMKKKNVHRDGKFVIFDVGRIDDVIFFLFGAWFHGLLYLIARHMLS